MKRVLVTGADGQLGLSLQEIAKEFKALNFNFTTKENLDITNAEEVKYWFGREHYDYCINCAAYTQVDEAEKTPEKAFTLNAEGVKMLALEAKATGTILVHISTDYVFDGRQKEGYRPTDQPNPINQYGKSKLKGEEYLKDILDNYVIVRTSWLYSEFGRNFYKTILDKARRGETLHVTDSEIGCPTKASNLARYILNNIANRDNWQGTYHFSDGVKMSWYQFAHAILKENGLLKKNNLKRLDILASKTARPKWSILLP